MCLDGDGKYECTCAPGYSGRYKVFEFIAFSEMDCKYSKLSCFYFCFSSNFKVKHVRNELHNATVVNVQTVALVRQQLLEVKQLRCVFAAMDGVALFVPNQSINVKGNLVIMVEHVNREGKIYLKMIQ